MGNNFISYFTSRPGEGVDSLAADDKEDATTPVSLVEEVPEVDSVTDKQCVAWEIDVSNWKQHGRRGNKTKRRRDGRPTCLREKNNVLVGGAREVTSEETKPKLAKVTLPEMKTEVKMAQCCDDIKEKKVLDLKRWQVKVNMANHVTMVICDQVLYE